MSWIGHPCRRPMMLGERLMRNIWLLIPGMEEHELDVLTIGPIFIVIIYKLNLNLGYQI